ncbi:MAG TPA: energy-coupling factor transporter transmembrane component T [Syntrophales bacterium]|nr:energy-coupling factor transporter transmembrane component T [Syntrophales bacterium]
MKTLPLGQFVPGDSPVHRFDPRVKILCALLLSIVILNAGLAESLAVTMFLLAAAALSGLSARRIAEALKPLAWFFAILFFLHLFFTDGRPILPSLGAVTYEGLERGLSVTWQFVALVVSAAILTMTTAPSELVGGLEKLLRPLNRIGIPSHDIAIMVSVSLRFVPTLLEEVERMKEAQVARGADFGSGPIIGRLKKMATLVIPLILCTFRRADELALAMEGRGYHRGPRTYLRELRFTRVDYAALFAFTAFLIGIGIMRFLPF